MPQRGNTPGHEQDAWLAYQSNSEHLGDELRRLDLLLHLQLRHKQTSADSPLAQLKGLVVTSDEIAPLLRPEASRDASENPRHDEIDLAAALHELQQQIDARVAASADQQTSLELPYFVRLFGLNGVEQACLLACLAAEVDRKYEKLFAYVQDDVTRKRPSIDLVLSLSCGTLADRLAARECFAPDAPLRKYRLVEIIDSGTDGPTPQLGHSLKLDDRVVDQLLGNRHLDRSLEHAARLLDPATESSAGPQVEQREQMRGLLETLCSAPGKDVPNVLFHIHGHSGADHQRLAAAAADELQLPLLVCDARMVLASPVPEEVLWRVARETVLQPAVLCIENFSQLAALQNERPLLVTSLLDAAQSLSRVTFLLGAQAWRPPSWQAGNLTYIELKLPAPGYGERVDVWQSQLRQEAVTADIDVGALASKFRLSARHVGDAITAARDQARWRSPEDPQPNEHDIYAACRAHSNPELASLAHKIEPVCSWRDLILPADQFEHLQEICNQARNRHVVLGQWGFERKLSYGKGQAVLFSGPPGTGKTMAAEIVAGELGLDLFKIDLSRVVSKYIGETEKNLDRIFTAAEEGNAILFFDEADSLFGKRSEVRDSHDRYANLEISYLLQKMEEYEGLSILATNLRKHLDEAFLRRLQTIVEFPFPDAQDRERIWRIMFSEDVPLGDDVDLGRLAREMPLAGGNIKNISLNAAYLAANNGRVVRMPHLAKAARREHAKLGRSWTDLTWADAKEAQT